MKFGVFDHVDDCGVPMGQQLEDRLRLTELYDRSGFHAYHVAEHHGTPLGRAPSPGIFLSAVAQRTRRLRFGPLVYLLPLYHPLRLIEEIALLDQLSGGRLELGVGRGASPIEVGFFGVSFDTISRQFAEALDVIRQGLASDELTFHGEFYRFDRVPMVLKPVQKPHPPLWYGSMGNESATWAARNDSSIICLSPAAAVRPIGERFHAERLALGKPPAAMPCVGLSRHVVLAETEAAAKALAARAYRSWRGHMSILWEQFGTTLPLNLPAEFEQLAAARTGFAGTPDGARAFVAAQVAASGASYFVADLAFGDMSFEEAARSAELFANHVMPAFKDEGLAAAD